MNETLHLAHLIINAYCTDPAKQNSFTFLHTLGRHDDWAKIDFSKVVWLKSGQPFQPDMNKTLAEQGIKHKDALRLQTPGLNGNGTNF